MNQNIKTLFLEGEKEWNDRSKYYIIPEEIIGDAREFWNSRQISLIKMIGEMVESEKKKIPDDCGEDCYCPYCEKEHDFNKSLDTISSKLKELIKE